MGQTGQSDAIHSPEACATMVVRLMIPAAPSIAVVCGRDLVLAKGLAHDVEPACERRVTEALLRITWATGPDRGGQRLFGIDEFGLRLGERCGERRNRFTGSLQAPNVA
jgi:hypothetical protein